VLRDVIFEINKETLEAMFKSFKSENLIRDLSFAMTSAIYMPGDYIITKDQEGEEMFFIIEGTVSVIGSDQSTVIKTLSKGAYFGEVAIFMKIKRTASIQAKTPCILGILKRADIERILESFPKVAQAFIT
jgi:F-box/leucine-rich repeat protein 7